jgi:hypoxanthine phosphoribosyltransferase
VPLHSLYRNQTWLRQSRQCANNAATATRSGCGKFVKESLRMSSISALSEFENPQIEVLISADELQNRIKELGAAITRDYLGRHPELICVLKGAMVFMSDLMRAIDLELAIDFIAVSSYGKGARSTGEVKIVKDLDEPLEGRDIILVEDILDTGLTLSYLVNSFRARGATSIKIVTLLNKPERRKAQVEADYVGFIIPDKFVVGYGLDFAERYRNLPYIGVVKGS